MKKYTHLILSSCILLFISCNANKTVIKTKQQNTILKEIIIDKTFTLPEENNFNYKILQAGIKDSILTISLQYKGCKVTDEFDLYFNGRYQKSLPLQASLYLLKKQDDKECEDTHYSILKYNISKLKHESNTIIIINLKPYTKKLVYKY